GRFGARIVSGVPNEPALYALAHRPLEAVMTQSTQDNGAGQRDNDHRARTTPIKVQVHAVGVEVAEDDHMKHVKRKADFTKNPEWPTAQEPGEIPSLKREDEDNCSHGWSIVRAQPDAVGNRARVVNR